MKILLVLLMTTIALFAQKVEITADKFEADENRHISILSGNVTLKKGLDLIRADKLLVTFDKDNKPIKYIATGDINFHIKTDDREFEGKANKLKYDPKSLKYEISGNVVINDLTMNHKLIGQKIVIDRISGKSQITGKSNHPVKFIFDVQE